MKSAAFSWKKIWLKSQRVARTKLRCLLFNEHVKREGPREKTGKAGSVIYIVIDSIRCSGEGLSELKHGWGAVLSRGAALTTICLRSRLLTFLEVREQEKGYGGTPLVMNTRQIL
jgi:hypothetical protein